MKAIFKSVYWLSMYTLLEWGKHIQYHRLSHHHHMHVEQCHLGGKCARFFALTIRVPSSLAGPTDLIVFTPTGIGTFTNIKEMALTDLFWLKILLLCQAIGAVFWRCWTTALRCIQTWTKHIMTDTEPGTHSVSRPHSHMHAFFFHILYIATIILCIHFLDIMTNFRDMLWEWNTAICSLGKRTSFQRRCD